MGETLCIAFVDYGDTININIMLPFHAKFVPCKMKANYKSYVHTRLRPGHQLLIMM